MDLLLGLAVPSFLLLSPIQLRLQLILIVDRLHCLLRLEFALCVQIERYPTIITPIIRRFPLLQRIFEANRSVVVDFLLEFDPHMNLINPNFRKYSPSVRRRLPFWTVHHKPPVLLLLLPMISMPAINLIPLLRVRHIGHIVAALCNVLVVEDRVVGSLVVLLLSKKVIIAPL